jgi:UDP-N-acetylglucosamine 2-epimerase
MIKVISLKKLNLLRVVGARPQFMQVKPLRLELDLRGHREILLHTGQHYDDKMSRQFFHDLQLPNADYNLEVRSGTHGEQTARMIQGIEAHLLENRYDAVVVDGDTNSTLAGALAACKLNIPVVHIEAGMRSFNRKMPEEINRVLTDHVSKLLFCPDENSKMNLKNEGITNGVHVVGDVLSECFVDFKEKSEALVESVLEKYGIQENNYILLTLHRAENVDDKSIFESYLRKISTSPWTVVWPLHPRTEKAIKDYNLESLIQKAPFKIIPPTGYLEMLALEKTSKKILTDSGGVQREAYYWRKPCAILRDRTEWVEILESGLSELFLPTDDSSKLWNIPELSPNHQFHQNFTGISKKIVDILEEVL